MLFGVGLALTVLIASLSGRFAWWTQGKFTRVIVESTGEIVFAESPRALFVHTHRPFGLDIRLPSLGTVETAYKTAPGVPFTGELGGDAAIQFPEAWWPKPSPDVLNWGAYRYRVGFPMRAFQYHTHGWGAAGGTNRFETHGVIRLRSVPRIGHLYIPYRPIWIGLLMNWFMWTGVVWLVVRLTGDRVRLRRKRRADHRMARRECVSCGYQLNKLGTCPECGQVTPPASSCV
ncbi:MAG: hypothetical protein AB8F26_03805 [Phycisphaerales bacterium]